MTNFFSFLLACQDGEYTRRNNNFERFEATQKLKPSIPKGNFTDALLSGFNNKNRAGVKWRSGAVNLPRRPFKRFSNGGARRASRVTAGQSARFMRFYGPRGIQ